MRLMLDTDICIYIIKRRPEVVLRQLRETVPGDVCISVVILAELQYGVAKSERSQQNAAALETFLLPVSVAPFDAAAADTYGSVRAALEKLGTPIGALDTMIAAHALSRRVDLVTNNTGKFRGCPVYASSTGLPRHLLQTASALPHVSRARPGRSS